ncbi:hypothetical protein [Nocardia miyunensis]|uniref:hypothetical protein n=1 Tax=Nocardia miyunensis TaxID=282684 RepID=UPI0012F477D1|nr:hypothetical protein [Nocardia miyunensis]
MTDKAAALFRMNNAHADSQTSPRRVHDLIRTAIRDGLLSTADRLNEDVLVRSSQTGVV